MVWTQRLMRTAFIFLVMMTVLADQSNADIQIVWIPVGDAEVNDGVYILQSDGHRLYGAIEYGLVVSDDNGATWRTIGFFEDGVSAFTIHGNTIYVGSLRDAGMFRSDDGGETWKPINNGLRLFEDSDGDTYYGWIKQILVTRSGSIITVMHGPIYISHDRGETWQDVTQEWYVPAPVEGAADYYLVYNDAQLLEFDGYLWAALQDTVVRSPDNGRTWEFVLPQQSLHFPTAWLLHNNRIYVAAEYYGGETAYFGRYEDGLMSPPMVQGLPPHPVDPLDRQRAIKWPYIEALVSHDGRIFAAIRRRGVYVFNERSETWSFVGLNGAKVDSLASHESDLYAVTDEGIYRAAIRSVLPHDKALTTWGALKTK